MFNSIVDAVNWIESVKKFGDKLDLSRMEIACEKLGHPELNLNIIHIAGTNGKGSTVSYLKHILLEHGYSVGTFTSPYIVSFNERITYNKNNISDIDLLIYINKVNSLYNEVLQESNQVITFFELITLISFLYFNDHQCDYVLYEVGLGGTLDATNVIKPIITAITSISFDHMGVLGSTLEEIALNKLGIVKDGVPLVTAIDQLELMPLFKSHTAKHNAELTFINYNDITNVQFGDKTQFSYKNSSYSIKMLGNHQVYNASLSIEILTQLEKNNQVSLDKDKLYNGLLKTNWPGRLEKFNDIYLDGAHNVGGAKALKESISSLFVNKTIKVLFTSMADKEYSKVIEILDPVVDEFYFTQFDYPRCETADELYRVASNIKSGKANKFIRENATESFHELKDNLQSNEILIVTGSLYFISYIRKELFI